MPRKKNRIIDETVLQTVRQRHGLDESDESRDEEFKAMSPMELLRACVGWELGDGYWADTILDLAEECGFKITPAWRDDK